MAMDEIFKEEVTPFKKKSTKFYSKYSRLNSPKARILSSKTRLLSAKTRLTSPKTRQYSPRSYNRKNNTLSSEKTSEIQTNKCSDIIELVCPQIETERISSSASSMNNLSMNNLSLKVQSTKTAGLTLKKKIRAQSMIPEKFAPIEEVTL